MQKFLSPFSHFACIVHISGAYQLSRCSPETFTIMRGHTLTSCSINFYSRHRVMSLPRDFTSRRITSAFASVFCSRSILFVQSYDPIVHFVRLRRTPEYSFVTIFVTSESCKFAFIFVRHVTRRIIQAFLKVSYVKSHVNSICLAFAQIVSTKRLRARGKTVHVTYSSDFVTALIIICNFSS